MGLGILLQLQIHHFFEQTYQTVSGHSFRLFRKKYSRSQASRALVKMQERTGTERSKTEVLDGAEFCCFLNSWFCGAGFDYLWLNDLLGRDRRRQWFKLCVAPGMGIAHGEHRTQNVVPGLKLHHYRVRKHATVPTNVL